MSEDNYGACIVLLPYPNGLPDNVKGGQHITLAYLGDETRLDEAQELELIRLSNMILSEFSGPLYIQSKDIERFGEDGDAVVLTLDDSDMSSAVLIRNRLLDEFSSELNYIFKKNETYPVYRPHMTLGYISEGYEDNVLDIPQALSIRGIGIWNGNSRTVINYKNDYTIAHYGILRKSGRYPWGSGENPYQRSQAFYAAYNQLKAEGLKDTEIAKLFGEQSNPKNPNFNTKALRSTRSLAKDEKRAGDRAMILRLKDKNMSNTAIAERMGMPESTVRSLLKDSVEERVNITKATADKLRDSINKDQYLDIGKGTENLMGVSKDRLDTAISILEDEGYTKYWIKERQLGTGFETTVRVLAPPGVEFPEVANNKDRIKYVDWHSDDKGRTFTKPDMPKNVSPKRIEVIHKEDGGDKRDGLIEIRPGAKDLDLGHNKYAQVRIAVDGTHYLKGMAMYNPDLPDGVDIRFHTNKEKEVPLLGSKDNSILKPLKKDKDGNIDPDAPFGAMIKPGGQRGAVNIVNEEGDWNEWSSKLSSQMLSKQNDGLAKRQLDRTYKNKEAELEEIKSLTNPTVKKRLLEAFADNADSQAVTLKAMGLPRTATKVLMPFPELKDNEVYAPTYKNGEQVVLIRHPHGGVFEIPQLTVNNNTPSVRKSLGNAKDAIGINAKVAEQLSGADFDGDTVLVIPQKGVGPDKIKVSKPLEGLKDFDPQTHYKGYPGMKTMTNTQTEMGMISNLITDMTIKGANENEIAAAVRHSMVVIDAEKHGLNYKQSEIDNGIKRLKELYQPKSETGKGGASTIISRAKSRVDVPAYKPRPAKDGGPIDKETGKRVFVPTGETYVDKKGRTIVRTKTSEAMRETDDARTLVSSPSGTPIEMIYADHANRLKSLANQARKDMVNTPEPKRSPTAQKVYAPEVASLTANLNIALKNAPLERQAQIVGNAIVKAKQEANPGMDADELKKVRTRALDEARLRTGAKKQLIPISPREWEAIQARAVSPNKLREILRHADLDQVKEYATPRTDTGMTPALLARARALLNGDYTQAEVAEALGVSVSTLTRALK